MHISDMSIACDGGGTEVKIWAKCQTAEDVDTIIVWLHLAKSVMLKWEKINAKTSRPTKAAAGKDENHKPRQVQSEPQI